MYVIYIFKNMHFVHTFRTELNFLQLHDSSYCEILSVFVIVTTATVEKLNLNECHTSLSKIGSSAGSNSSPMFSSKHGFPNLIEFSKLLRKSRSVSLMTSTPASFSWKTITQLTHFQAMFHF